MSFPALVVASAWGIAPQLAALVTAVGFGGAQERLARAGRVGGDAATGLLLVAALAVGVVLASDVYGSGAEVDTLLFGSLLGLSERDVWLTALVAGGAVLLDAGLRRHWLAAGFEPASARALGLRPVLADRLLLAGIAAAAVVAIDAVGALLVTVVLVVPAATVRLVCDRLGALQAGTVALAAAEGVARGLPRRRAQRRRRPRARGAGRRRLRRRRGGDGAARAGGAGVSVRVEAALRRLRPGCGRAARRGLRGRDGRDRRRARTQRRRQDHALPRAARRAAGPPRQVELPGRPAYVPQTERARLDFPVSAFDVVLMGAFARTPWFRRVGRRDRGQAHAALERVGLADRAGTTFGALSGGQRQRVLIARALLQEADVLLLDEPLSGVDGVSAARIEAVFAALKDEGRTLLVATHDVRQAKGWDRVLCLHGRQIDYGRARRRAQPRDAARDLRRRADRARGRRHARSAIGHHGHAH